MAIRPGGAPISDSRIRRPARGAGRLGNHSPVLRKRRWPLGPLVPMGGQTVAHELSQVFASARSILVARPWLRPRPWCRGYGCRACIYRRGLWHCARRPGGQPSFEKSASVTRGFWCSRHLVISLIFGFAANWVPALLTFWGRSYSVAGTSWRTARPRPHARSRRGETARHRVDQRADRMGFLRLVSSARLSRPTSW
jgi:hypothetical protein